MKRRKRICHRLIGKTEVIVREERIGKKKVFIVNCKKLGIADFGYTLHAALKNFNTSLNLFLNAYPEKTKLIS